MLPPPNPPARPLQSAPSGQNSHAGPSRYRAGQDDGLPRYGHRYDAVPGRVRDEDARTLWTDPVEFQHGLFAGKVVRFNLEVAQQPIHGRRKTEKDRRPLAHVPILRFRAKECWPNRYRPEWDEEELDVSAIDPTLLVCSASIGAPNPPPSVIQPNPVAADYGKVESATARLSETRPSLPALTDSLSLHRGPPTLPTPPLRPESTSSTSLSSEHSAITEGRHLPPPNWSGEPRQSAIPGPGPSSLRHRASWTADSDYNRGTQMLHYQPRPDAVTSRSFPPDWAPPLGDASRRRQRQEGKGESSSDESNGDLPTPKRVKPGSPTRNLYGNLHVSAVRVPAMEGGLGLWFLFTDLCVRHEGTYSLHFKCFDLSALPGLGSSPVPPLADCFSEDFKVYSPRNFPGLPKQTELSEHFSRQGFKLNTRKNERHAPSPEPPPAAGPSSSRPRPSFTSLRSAPQNLQRPERPAPQPLQQQPVASSSSTEQSTSSSTSSMSRTGHIFTSSSSITGTRTSGSSGGSHMSSGGVGQSIMSAREAKFKSDKLDLTEELEEEEERERGGDEDEKGRLAFRQSSVRDAG